MLSNTKPKSIPALERAVAKYEKKHASAKNPTQRQYAWSMLQSARKAITETRKGEPIVEDETDERVVDLDRHEYQAG